MNGTEARTGEEGGRAAWAAQLSARLSGARGSGLPWVGSRGPRSSQFNPLGFPGKAESERELAGRLSHPVG